MNDESVFLRHEPCPDCGSQDNLGRYSDGHAHCFGCGYYEKADGTVTPPAKRSSVRMSDVIDGSIAPLRKRGISEETCNKWNYRVGELNDKPVQIANYMQDGQVVAQKVRFKNKDFTFLGNTKKVGLYGQWLWRDSGRMVVVTEGEIDALSVSQLQNNKWPVVSVPNGAQGAKKSIQKNLEWLEQYETVIFMFDNDEPGIAAAKQCAQVLTPGKAKIASLPLKDANEMLVAGRGKEVIDAIWGAKVYRPDGIVSGSETWDSIINEDYVYSVPYPWDEMNEKTHGLRVGEITTFTAGSGIGKSQVTRELSHHLIKLGETVGIIALEENTKRTALGLMSIELNKSLHLSREGVSEDELKKAWEATVGNGKVFLYDHWGSIDSSNLLNRVRYLARGCGCRYVVLDHLSIVVSGIGDGDERRLIDNTMTELRSLVEETGVGLILVSHLKRPEGKGHEEGAQTSLSQLRGSASIAQLSDMVIGLERNQQADKPNLTTVRILKNRFSGETGVACYLSYDNDTGRMVPGSLFDDETGGGEEEEF